MLEKIHQFAKPKELITLWILLFMMAGGVMSTMSKKMEAISGNIGPIDLLIPSYSIQTAHNMIAAYGAEGRALYRIIELTVDVIYPLIYGLAFALLIAFVWRKVASLNYWTRRLPLLAVAAVAFDFLENIAIVTLLSTYPLQLDSVAFLASIFSLMKWLFFFASLFSILVGVVLYFSKKRKRKGKTLDSFVRI